MAVIASSVPSTAIGGDKAWANRILVCSDGRRVVLWSDGTDLKMSHASDGTSWTAFGTIQTGVTSLDNLGICAVMAGDTLCVFLASGSSILTRTVAYTASSATWGAVQSPATFGALAYAPQTLRAVYDPAGLTTATGHTTGTGIIHLLADVGATWHVYALDPHNTPSPAIAQQTSIATGLTTPTATTNMLLRRSGDPAAVYIITDTGSGWLAREVAYTQVTTGSTGGTTSGPSVVSLGGAGTFWQGGPEGGGATKNPLATGTYRWRPGTNVGGSLISPVTDSQGGTWGTTMTPPTGYNYPAGIWTLAIGATLAGGIVPFPPSWGIRIYRRSSGGALTLVGIIPDGAAGDKTVTATLPAFGIVAGDSLYIEPYAIVRTTIAAGSIGGATDSNYITALAGTLTTTVPTYTGGSSSTTDYEYQVGVAEAPALPRAALGAALCLADTTANPGIDISIADLTVPKLVTAQRTNTGGYSLPTSPWGTQPRPASSPAASSSTANADEGVLVKDTGTYSGHAALVARTAGAWSGDSEFDTSAGIDRFMGVSPGALARTGGQAIVYTDLLTPKRLVYEDAGAVSSALAPSADGFAFITTPGAAFPDVYGSGSIYNVTTVSPWWQLVYRSTTVTDPMSAYAINATYLSTGKVSVTGGPTNGGVVQHQLTGGSPTKGTSYAVTAQVWESVANIASPLTAALTLYLWDAPVLTLTDPGAITSQSLALTFHYAQAQSRAMSQWRAEFIDATTGVTVFDTGITAGTTAAGTDFTTPSIALNHMLATRTNYTLRVTAYASALAGAPFAGAVSQSVVTNYPTPSEPTSFTVAAVPGTKPAEGGYVQLRWQQANSTPPAATFLVERQEVDEAGNPVAGWLQVGNAIPAPDLTGGTVTMEAHDYTIPCAVAHNYRVSALEAGGYPSIAAEVRGVRLDFRLGGIWLNDADDPTSCLELGIRPSGGAFPQMDPQQDKAFLQLMNRTGFVTQTGPFYALQTSADMTYILESRYERAGEALLRQWDKAGTDLQIRSSRGDLLIGALTHASFTQDTKAVYHAVVLGWTETDQRDAVVPLVVL